MPIKPSKFKKLPKIVQKLVSASRQRERARDMSRSAHSHVREVNAHRVGTARGGGLPESDVRYFLATTNEAEFRHSRASQKAAEAKAKLSLTRKGRLMALKDVRIEKSRQRALRESRRSIRRMKL